MRLLAAGRRAAIALWALACVTRIAAAAIEQNHDGRGIIWQIGRAHV